MLEILKQRRSCRNYDRNHMVEDAKIAEVVQAGLHAASGMNSQKGIVIVITNPEIRDRISDLNRRIGGMGEGADPFYGAPVILLVACQKWRLAPYDGSTMIENMLIEATNQGLGSCWIHRAKEELESEEGREILKAVGLSLEEYEGVGHVALGYALSGPRDKTIAENRVFYLR